MIMAGKKRAWGPRSRQRIRANVAMREMPNRLHHIGGQGDVVRRIALVGTTDSGALAPFGDETWEIWGVGGRREWMSRATRWYEVHRLAGESEEWVENWREQAGSFDGQVDIYMHYPEPGFGGRVFAYPADHIMARFGTYFMTSSFAWMMAAAIDELRPKDGEAVAGEIAVFGIDMERGAEYLQQRAGLHHFIDVARVLGIRVTRLASSGISFEPIPYPMWQDDPLLNKLDKRQSHARDRLIDLDRTIAATTLLIVESNAAMTALTAYGVVVDPAAAQEEVTRLQAELVELKDTLKTMQEDLIHWDGVEDEQQWLRDYISQ
jgi:hypothetical protein